MTTVRLVCLVESTNRGTGENMKPITPQLQVYPSELRRRLDTAERTLQLQDQFIVQSRAILALTEHLLSL